MKNRDFPSFRAAIVQAAPVFLDRDATIEKMDDITASAAAQGGELVVYGESFVPGFPIWNAVLPPVEQHILFRRLVENAI